MKLLNIHVHTFTFNHVPSRFIPCMKLVLWLHAHCPKLMNHLLPEKITVFLMRGTRKNQLQILNELGDYYPKDACFAVHSMDFEYMNAGKCSKEYSFIKQLDELSEIAQSTIWEGRIYPFICVDPRRAGIVELAKYYIEQKGFVGIKLYPTLGYHPNDERLDHLWKWAEEQRIPIMTHCSRSALVRDKKKSKAECDSYTSPKEYIPIFEKYPNIKICFAHFGGDNDCIKFYKYGNNQPDNWFGSITQLIRKYEGAYADISYSTGNADLMALFHVYALETPNTSNRENSGYSMRDKILFGSDYYMAHLSRNERWFSINVRSCMREDTYWKLMENAESFLWK